MGYKYLGDNIIYASLTVQTPKPLDTRTVVEDINDLYTVNPDYAYQGMTVANINDGNLYMLVDKNKITEKAGWKASYESILIITCTQEEYNTWESNTTEDYKPIKDNLTYLRRDVYYYIYEEEENSLYYVTKTQIDNWLGSKASAAEVNTLKGTVQENSENYKKLNTIVTDLLLNLDSDFITSEQLQQIYATKNELLTINTELSEKFNDYYTSDLIDQDFVTKASLKGGLEGDDDFVFVTQNLYTAEKEEILSNIQNISNNIGEGIDTKKISTNEIVFSLDKSVVISLEGSLLFNADPIAMKKEIPKIEMVTKSYYDSLTDTEKESETYYYLYDDGIVGYITYDTALETFYNKGLVNTLISEKIAEREAALMVIIEDLQKRIISLENPLEV